MKIYKNSAFTLVELIVVITILAILGTIAFISLQGYSAQSRDSTRITDLSSIKTTLELFQLDAGKYPEPTNWTSITYSGGVVWNQGLFGDSVFKNVTKLDKVPTDPLTESKYTYSITSNKNEYELAGVMEGDSSANFDILNNTFAGDKEAIALVTGKYNGQMTKTLSGTTCNTLSIPSIISSDIETSTDLVEITNNERFVYDGFNNLPHSFKSSKFKVDGGFKFIPNKLVAYTDTGSCTELTSKSSYTARVQLLKGLQESYSGTTLKGKGKIKRLLALDINTSSPSVEVQNFAGSFVNNNLGGSVEIISNSSSNGPSIPVCDSACLATWSNEWNLNNGASGKNILTGVEVDSDGNIYVGGINYTSTGSNDFYIRKLDPYGIEIWENTFDIHNRGDINYGIKLDSNNNIYAVGSTSISPSNYNFYVRKFNSDGSVIWSNEWDGYGGSDSLHGIDIDSNNNLYVIGTISNAGNTNFYLRKMSSNGVSILSIEWVKYTQSDYLNGITIDVNNNIYVVGYTRNSTDRENFYIRKLDSNLVELWEKDWDIGGVYNILRDVDLDTNNNIYVTGLTVSGSTFDYYLSKLDTDGNNIWSKTWTSGVYNGIQLDSNDNIYLAGNSNSGNYDFNLRKLDSDGNEIWMKEWDLIGDWDYLKGIDIDLNDNIYVVGSTDIGIDGNFYLRKFDPDGN